MIAAAPTRGEADDFETWVAARGPALTRYAYLVCGDESESQDLVQAALEKAWPRWRSISHQGDPEAYLRRGVPPQSHYQRSDLQMEEAPPVEGRLSASRRHHQRSTR